MEWLDRMMDAIDYMEKHMEEQPDMEAIARTAYSSTFHFQRMFHMLTGMTVAEYMRKRKLTLAAQELAVLRDARVLDIAIKYGYDSPESFAKAFRRVHGITPSAAREPGANLKAYPRISFHLSLKGDKDMDYRIVERKEYEVVGKLIKVSCKDGENFRRIPEFWGECHKDGTIDKLCSVGTGNAVLGICMDMELDKEQMAYMIAVEHNGVNKDDSLTTRKIPAATWAVFTSVGPLPSAIQKVTERIFQE
ncbi:MAG TPA: helix-turn-helix domain-containing protein, partial [Candidatus Nitrosocosmicus sp.]|nr:helix-turn-helix domain-containing protein [Candidatus Nitrosocosmicus sp.]